VSTAANASKRRVAISAFDYAAVKTAVTSIAGNDVNIGQGIRSMLMVKMAQSKTVVLLEREKIGAVMKEQDFGATNRVKQGTNAKIGQITGADPQLFGDIVTFGRDDTTKRNGAGAVARAIPVFGGIGGRVADSKTSDKAVVVINLRLVDAETGEVIDAEEARGESTRTSTNWGAVAGSWRGGAGANSDMTSSNFGSTIIGEATQDAVNKIAAILEQKMSGVSAKSRTIEGKVANFDGCTLYLSVGGNDGVHVGDHFEIHQILKEVLDPDTKEVLDKQTVKVGDFIVSTVRDKVSIGQYGGQPLSPTYAKGYAARMATQ
jgi:curli biogenesis system outer membrane secretion channel CsgG